MNNVFSYVNKKDFSFLNKREHKISNVQENIELAIYSMIAFFVPFFLAHPQTFVGVIVNAALVMGALNLRGKKLLPIIMLPSLGVVSAGIIFGTLTPFLLYMVPFIWVGNAILVFTIKKFVLDNKINKIQVLGASAIAKTAFLFLSALVLVNLSVLPAVFLSVMGALQLVTAFVGGILAYGTHMIKNRVF